MAAAILALPLATYAQNTTSWTGGATGDWSTPGNWSEGAPTSSTVFTLIDGATTVQIDGTTAAANVFRLGTEPAGGTSPQTFLSIINGGTLVTGDAYLANYSNLPGGHAEVTLSGAGSSWTATQLFIANGSSAANPGTGIVTVNNGATLNVTGNSIDIATHQGRSGSLNLDHATLNGGEYTTLNVGRAGDGAFNITGGSHATLYALYISSNLGSTATTPGSGAVTIDASNVTITGFANMASSTTQAEGNTSLEIVNGSVVNIEGANGLWVGSNSSFTDLNKARVTLSGAGTELNLTRFDQTQQATLPAVLNLARGIVEVSEGAVLRGNLQVGNGPAFNHPINPASSRPRDNAILTISGNGSLAHNQTEVMEVGRLGEGRLVVADRGTLRVGATGEGYLAIGMQSTSSSGWAPANPPGIGILQIGDGGSAGTLEAYEIQGGGTRNLGQGQGKLGHLTSDYAGGDATVRFNHNEEGYLFGVRMTQGGNANSTGTFRVEHIGTGTTTLTANHSYQSGTFVHAGTLLIEGEAEYLTDQYGTFLVRSGTGAGIVQVGSEGRLGGSGDIGGATTISGTLLAGTDTGSLHFLSDLTLEEEAVLHIGLNGPVADFDAIKVDGNLSIAGSVMIDLQEGFSETQTFTLQLFDHLSDPDLDYTLTFQWTETGWDVTQTGLGGQQLDVAVVPEPGTVGLLTVFGLGVLGWRRMRRGRAIR